MAEAPATANSLVTRNECCNAPNVCCHIQSICFLPFSDHESWRISCLKSPGNCCADSSAARPDAAGGSPCITDPYGGDRGAPAPYLGAVCVAQERGARHAAPAAGWGLACTGAHHSRAPTCRGKHRECCSTKASTVQYFWCRTGDGVCRISV